MKSTIRFIYFGSFRLSADVLSHLVKADFMPIAVICNPDRPFGRKKIITPPAIKQLITEKKWPIKILQPEHLNVDELKKQIGVIDLAIVMGYPKIISQQIIGIPKLGTIGTHPSLLPKYRGASPIQSVLLNGEKETGVTLYLMDTQIDHGPILATAKLKIAKNEDNPNLESKLAKLAGSLIAKTIPLFIAGKITTKEQNHSQATFTKKFTSVDAEVDIKKNSPLEIYQKIQALNPEPGVFTLNYPSHEGQRVKLLKAQYTSHLTITQIQIAGKKPKPANFDLKP